MDKEKLLRKGFIVKEEASEMSRMVLDRNDERNCINYINVSNKTKQDLMFNELVIGRKKFNKNLVYGFQDYEWVDVTVPSVLNEDRTNETNVSDLSELIEAFEKVEEELYELGFGNVYLLGGKVKNMEINCNIPLRCSFKEYKRVMEYIKELLPYRMRKKSLGFSVCKGYSGWKSGNGSVDLKIYDKRKELKDKKGKDIGYELLRIEYTFLNSQKIKSIFGTNELKKIVGDDFEAVRKAFRECLRKDIVEKLYEDIEIQRKHCIKAIKEYKKLGGISSIDAYLKNYQNEIIDIEIVLSALKEIEKSNYARECRRAIKSASEIKGINLFGNIDKINEVLGALGYEKICLDMNENTKKMLREHYKKQ